MNWEEWYLKEDPWRIKEGNKFTLKWIDELKKLINKIKLNGLHLDGGCGEGYVTSLIFKDLDVRFIGIDISRKALKRVKGLESIKMLFKETFYNSHLKIKLSILFCFWRSIYYVKDWRFCLDEAKRILKKNGYILLSVALGKNYLRYWEVNKEFRMRFSLLDKMIVGTSIFGTLAKILLSHPQYAKLLLLGQKIERVRGRYGDE